MTPRRALTLLSLPLTAGLGRRWRHWRVGRRGEEGPRGRRRKAGVEELLPAALAYAAPVGMAFLDEQLRFRGLNAALAAMNGPTPEAHLGRALPEVVPELAPRIIPLLRQVLRSGRPLLDAEVSGCTPAHPGEVRSWTVNYFPLTRNGLRGVGLTVTDVTERKRAEEALRASEAELRAILASIQDVVLVIDHEGRYREVAPTNPALLYRPAEELVGKTFAELFPEELARSFLGHVRRALALRQTVDFEYALPIDGMERWFAASLSPMLEDRVIWVARDITEQRRREEDERFLSRFSGGLTESLELQQLLGWAVEQAGSYLGQWSSILLLPEGAQDKEWEEVWARAPVQAELTAAARDVVHQAQQQALEEDRPLLVPDLAEDAERWCALCSAGMQRLLAVPVGRGTTRQGTLCVMRAEGQRPFDARDVALALEVAHRTETALVRARLYRDARLAVRVRDEFLSIAAHELKTPLTALQAHIHLMMRQAGAGDLSLRGERLLRQTGRLTRLIDNLLDVSRISAGKLTLQPEEFELGEVVREVAERYAEEAREAGCRLEVQVEPGVRGAWDRLRMEQVVTNLLSNALKYGAGKPVEVRLERANGQARLWVVDQGMGIAPENLERIFGVFERAAPVRHYGGLGLGLHIARQIIAAHGGDIHVRSVLGQGSTFWVEVPLQSVPWAGSGLQEESPVI